MQNMPQLIYNSTHGMKKNILTVDPIMLEDRL